ncbi:MAG: hypothetical protein KZQ64_11120 [gamma proteobacterium symbiont of Bathyaustriella thionipta]|nr:hypothetical protein [gamma proteobacterium symbiont of Bathyaustriella thionipta]MCU7950076.1 hypothetical protein [gamma proteobacterium symbiont of Bathyaustriella thionipta]MCU7953926.1 hypothetical protein [gamma proteobacterium symbiont of Bathyaustriella thionipta]MCU7956661.1 hypothetical protein [gamma proteobacterium symbiont of Bathyaustriella thionipta]MCU7967869.1 hypothetical protein [gamma proteobacterium symbiont of Bathyaustriella thionipta]
MMTNTLANQVKVVAVDVKPRGDQQYQFNVTLLHDDTGWEHYADRWEILDTSGNILATRTLHHPHVSEQPFTRSLTATLPANTKTVIIRGHDSVHQYDGNEIKVSIP